MLPLYISIVNSTQFNTTLNGPSGDPYKILLLDGDCFLIFQCLVGISNKNVSLVGFLIRKTMRFFVFGGNFYDAYKAHLNVTN